MADSEIHEQPDSPTSSPESNAEAPGELKAAKDRSCPFCNQAFTSSSLGRHLDLYIKSKNPKPPDGLHHVDEIKKIRGGITRRQARTSLKSKENDRRREPDGSQSVNGGRVVGTEARATDGSNAASPAHDKDNRMHTFLNVPNWQTTGVINDIPARSPSRTQNATPSGQAQRMQEMRRDTTGSRIQRPEHVSEDIWKLQESAEVGRAAEMALREVLGSLEAAQKRTEDFKLFDFDFCALAFPGLCLAILGPPPTLFSSTPFPVAHTWSLAPPGERQFETCNRMLNQRISEVRNGMHENVSDSLAFTYHAHLQGAWEHWRMVPEEEKASSWNLELARAFVKERNVVQRAKSELEYAQQRIRHLEAEYERMSRCQLPREYLLHPPNTTAVSPAVMKEVTRIDGRSAAHEVNYDADALLNRWRATVKTTARPQRPPPLQSQYSETTRNPLKGDMIINGSVIGVNGIMPRDDYSQAYADDRVAVTYETPQHPGTIIAAEDEAMSDAHMSAGTDPNGDPVNGAFAQEYNGQRALMKRRRSDRTNRGPDGILSESRKRPLAPDLVNGREAGPKVYREYAKS